ncbi:MAG: hypothetical protein ABL977_00935 [Candidatus Eisenbacteria bacterium]
MHRSLIVRQVAPAALLLLGLIAAAIVLDAVLHVVGLDGVGLWLGPIGTGMLVASFGYSLRKRKKITWGQPKRMLELHQALGWFGSLALLVHGGGHFNALLPWLAMVAMVVVAASGMVGAVLLRRALEIVRENAQAAGTPPAEARHAVLDAMTVDLMKKWRVVHMPLNAVFLTLATLHIVVAVLFRSW